MRDIQICEVGPRDGLQLVRQVMPTQTKRDWIEALARCGFGEIDATSFVPPQVFPQFADAAEMVQAARAADAHWRVGALVPNARGAERAIAAGARLGVRGGAAGGAGAARRRTLTPNGRGQLMRGAVRPRWLHQRIFLA